MHNRQKETVLELLKSDKTNKNYDNRYWFSYKDFLDPTDDFTCFACEDLDGKQEYIVLIESLLKADETARIFVEVYGFEETNNEQFIWADTLIVFSKLSLLEIKQIFSEPEDIFPSDIGEETDFSKQIYIIGDNGDLVSFEELSDDYSVYYCWWD